MDENPDKISISLKKREANRRNAQRSTGPKTAAGKAKIRLNAIKHGMLASALIARDGGWEYHDQFEELASDLARDLRPVGKLEELLVQTIAVCYWRKQRALRFEARLIAEVSESTHIDLGYESDEFSLPLEGDLNRILRYETSNHRQLAYAIDQLERLQRARKGEIVPAPVSVQVSSDLLVLHGPNGSQT